MNKKLYVGNLSYDTTEEKLREAFSQAGPVVSVAVITDRMTGRPRGFAFVEMETEDAARDAIERLNDQDLDGRNIKVAEARPRRDRYSDRGQREGGGYGGGGYDRGGRF